MASSDQMSFVPASGWLRSASNEDQDFSFVFLLSMTAVGAVLRLFELLGPSLWVDEILTWHAVRPDAGLHFWEQVRDTIQGPLYLAAVWPLVHAHDTALMLRMPAAVAGILAVPVFGWLCFRLVDGRAARLALFLFALNPFHVWYSQEGRGYSFLLLFGLLTALCYFAMVRRGPTLPLVIGFALTGAAMVLSNLSGVFLLVAMGTTLVILHRPEGRVARSRWLLAFGLVAVLVAPWLLRASGIWAIDRIMPGAGTGAALRGVTTFSPLAVPYSFFTFFFGYSLGPSLRELHRPDRMAVLFTYLPLLVGGAASVGLAVVSGFARPDRRRITLLLWIVVPFAFGVLLALRNVKPWNPRYVAVALPWLLLLAGLGLARLPRRVGGVVALALVGLTLWSLAGYYGNGRYAKADVRSAAAWIKETVPVGGVVLVPVVTGVFEYYDRGEHRLLNSFGTQPLSDAGQATAYVDEVLAGVSSCQIVLAREWYFDPGGFLLPALSAVGDLQPVGQLPGVAIYMWCRRNSTEFYPGPGSQDDL